MVGSHCVETTFTCVVFSQSNVDVTRLKQTENELYENEKKNTYENVRTHDCPEMP